MKAMYKDILREIFRSKIRFISIFIITLLGVMTFIGLNVVSSYQQNTLDYLYKKYNSYDIQIKSNIGFNDKNIKMLNNLEYIKDLEYAYEKDIYLKGTTKVIKIKSMPKNISKIQILEGKFIDNPEYILLENKYKDRYKIGDILKLENDKNLTISGFFENVENRLVDTSDISYIGYAFSDFIVYTSDKFFVDEKYNIVNIKIKELENFKTFEDEYLKLSFEYKKKIESLMNLESKKQIEAFKKDAKEKINKSLYKIKESENEIINAEKKFESLNKKLRISSNTLKQKENEFKNAPKNFKLGYKKIEDANLEINKKAKELELKSKEIKESEKKILDGLKQIEAGFKEISKNEKNLKNGILKLNSEKEKVYNLKPSLFISSNKINEYKGKISKAEKEINEANAKLSSEKENLIKKKSELLENLEKIKDGRLKLVSGKIKIENAQKELKKQSEKITSEEKKYYEDYNLNKFKLKDAKLKIQENKEKLNNEYEKFINQKDEGLKKISEGKEKIKSSEKDVENIDIAFVYNSRNDNMTFRSFNEGVNSLKIISKIFPMIFYSIVILVITTALTRMVDEQRNAIGTYKFLGYSNFKISIKYIVYSLIPTFVGIILGIYGGTYLFPKIIYKGFNAGSISLYNNLIIHLDYKYILLSIFISVFATLISIWLSLKNELNENVANILREKAPKNGSKIYLENISFFWQKLSFFNKITLRNIFRYKVRMILNILGIAGCTALIFFSFSIKYSLDGVSDIQFNKIHKYNAELNLKPYYEKEEIINQINKDNEYYPLMKIVTKITIDKQKENNIFIYIIDDIDKLSHFIDFYDKKNDKIDFKDTDVIISQRTLEILNKKIGDHIIFEDIYSNKINLKITNVFKNYFSNYIFLSKKYYDSLNLEKYKVNSILLKNYDSKFDDLLKDNKIQNVNLSQNFEKVFDKISSSLDFIVMFIVLLSAILSIVVTYSLLEINVNERKKELATMKVLGFYHKELIIYIFKEIFIMTVIGILLGFVGGNALKFMIVESLKKTDTVLLEQFNILPYIYSTILTLLFSFISMFLIQINLKRINMVVSLKSE